MSHDVSIALSGWFLARLLALSPEQDHSGILCKRMSWMLAQTIAKQLVSVVNTSI
jgi:hypothetical protein